MQAVKINDLRIEKKGSNIYVNGRLLTKEECASPPKSENKLLWFLAGFLTSTAMDAIFMPLYM
ncbi:hypothetical protein [Microbulbifer sp. JMSA008]|uniref:hypothetical protein n=1 Tax=Microbulbifer sp. JMSA008 TaxID=3243373 RepID=UPI00403A6BAD